MMAEHENAVPGEMAASVAVTAFVAVTMVANIMSLRMVSPMGVVMDAGALLYPLTFILRDVLHRRAGLGAANAAVAMSAAANASMFALFAFAAWLPPDPATGEQAAFGAVLLPGALVVVGSVLGQTIGEGIDGAIFHRVWKGGDGSHVKAALASNLVSIPIDTAIMCGVAFGFTVPASALVSSIVANVAIKYAVMIAAVAAYVVGDMRNRR